MNTYDLEDTICAVATAPGIGGIAVVRVSGPDSIKLCGTVWEGRTTLEECRPGTVHYGVIKDGADILDEAVVTVWRSPHSYTGQNTVELSVHGSEYVQNRLLQILTGAGARMALPGEFTRRAFVTGRVDLARAEAVADVVAARTKAQHDLAVTQMRGAFSQHIKQLREKLTELATLLELELDFSEEDVTFAPRDRLQSIVCNALSHIRQLTDSFAAGNALRGGIPVIICGTPNAGKSTLLNALLGHDRAIVSAVPGTTRDTVEETIAIDGRLFRLVDTAGLRDTSDPVEQMGVQRGRRALAEATVAILVIDPTIDQGETAAAIDTVVFPPGVVAVINKTDLPDTTARAGELKRWLRARLPSAVVLAVSALDPGDIEKVRGAIAASAPAVANADAVVTNVRHYDALVKAAAALERVRSNLGDAVTDDLVAQDLREALGHLGEVIGDVTSDTVLSSIFSHFCVGK